MVKRILGGILFICIGIFLMIASIKMIFVDDPKAKKLLSEAVYVTTDTVDPANDGKAVIVFRRLLSSLNRRMMMKWGLP